MLNKFQESLFIKRKILFRLVSLLLLACLLFCLIYYFFIGKSSSIITIARISGSAYFSLLSLYFYLSGILGIINKNNWGTKIKGKTYGPIGISRGRFYIGEKEDYIASGKKAILPSLWKLLMGLYMSVFAFLPLLD